MPIHNGAVLCLNTLSFGSNPSKTRDEEHQAIAHAYAQAKELGAAPGAIVLQDYEFADAELIAYISQASGVNTWKAIHQWGDELTSERDTLVIYDTALYKGTPLEKDTIGDFRDTEDLLAGMHSKARTALTNFAGRWAAVELEPYNSDGQAELMFLLMSYHQRKMIVTDDDVIPVQTRVKAAMAKDFIAQAADVALLGDDCPALIAASWNIDSMPLVADGGVKSDSWSTTVHLTHTVETDKIGQPLNVVDYAVAIHPNTVTKTDLTVLDAITLSHPKELATHFQHKPMLFKIRVAPKDN